ncbi:TonB-dependent receptor [Herminiimonas aquatilis]|uniref:TonB-dependent receptor n=1 Tax=Herminiimonas aquatilis TaxID=345342 RepID=A0ABW2J2W4_9BURK
MSRRTSRPILKQTLIACALQAALPILAGTAFAQTADPANTTELTEIVVTSSADASAEGLSKPYAGGQVARGGRAGILGTQDMMDTPFSITSYTNELIQNQQAKSVADVLQNDPTVRIARGFGNFQELYMIRGFNVYSDDMSYNGLYGLLPRQYVAAELLERVEVFRGASAFLNGAAPGGSGIGGSINVVPKRAGNDPLTQVTIGVESGGHYQVGVDLSRRFGEDKASGLRVNAVRRDGETSVDNEKRELSLLSLGWDWRSRDVRVSTDLGYQEHKISQPRPSLYVGTVVPTAPDASKNFAQPWTYSNSRDAFGTVRGEIDFSDAVTGWAAAGIRKGRESNRLANPLITAANGDMSTYRWENERQDDVATGEVGLRGKLQTGSVKHAWTASASAFQSKEYNAFKGSAYNALQTNLYNPVAYAMPALDGYGEGNLSNPPLVGKLEMSSVALADTLSFLDDQLLLTLGARQQSMESYGYSAVTGTQESHNKKTKTSPIAGIVFKASHQVSVYANYIEGLEKGPVAPAYTNNRFSLFEPQVSEQKEVGVKYDFGKFGGTLAYFMTSRPSSYVNGANVFVVEGEQKNRGVELSLFGNVQRGLRLLGGLTVLDTEQKTSVASLNGKDSIGVPKTMANLGVEWDVPGMSGFSVNSRVVYTGSQYANGTNTLEIPSWTRVDLGARYLSTIANKLVTWRARVDNVANRDYWASSGGYPGQSYLVLGAPRTFTLSASIEF